MDLQPHTSTSLKFRKPKPSSRCHSHEADGILASLLVLFPFLSAPAIFTVFALSLPHSGRVLWMLFMSSDQTFCHFRPLDELQKSTALVDFCNSSSYWMSDCRWLQVFPSHLFSCLLLSSLRSASCPHSFPSWQFLVQPFECCTAIKAFHTQTMRNL